MAQRGERVATRADGRFHLYRRGGKRNSEHGAICKDGSRCNTRREQSGVEPQRRPRRCILPAIVSAIPKRLPAHRESCRAAHLWPAVRVAFVLALGSIVALKPAGSYQAAEKKVPPPSAY